jgi:hypothetical protein
VSLRPTIADLAARIAREEATSRIDVGTIVAADPRGTRDVSVRVSGGRVIERALTCVPDLFIGDMVVIAFTRAVNRPIIIAKVLRPLESDIMKQSVLAPPDNLQANAAPGSVHLTWDSYPGEDLCWQVQHNAAASEDGNEVDALITRGSYFIYRVVDDDTDSGAGVTRYFRVRAIRWINDSNVMLSAWSSWVNSTSVTWDGRYRTETELASVANAEGASLIGVEDSGGNFVGADVEAVLAELSAADFGNLSDIKPYSRGAIIRAGPGGDWQTYMAKTGGFILTGDGADILSRAFDWDNIAAGAGADMAHDHSSGTEGGVALGATSLTGVAVWESGGGLPYGGISGHAVADAITSVAQNDWDQIVGFNANDDAQSMTPDHTNDHITITEAGYYLATISWSGRTAAVPHDWEFYLCKNNNAAQFNNVATYVTTVTAARVVSVSVTGVVSLAASDTIELWTKRTSAGANIVLTTEHCVISLLQVGS